MADWPCRRGKCALPAILRGAENVRIAVAWADSMQQEILQLSLKVGHKAKTDHSWPR